MYGYTCSDSPNAIIDSGNYPHDLASTQRQMADKLSQFSYPKLPLSVKMQCVRVVYLRLDLVVGGAGSKASSSEISSSLISTAC